MLLINISPESPLAPKHRFCIQKRLRKIASTFWPNESHDAIKDKLKEVDRNGSVELNAAKKCWSDSAHSPQIKNLPSKIIEHYISATVYNTRLASARSSELAFMLIKHIEWHLGALEWQIKIFDHQNTITGRAVKGGNHHKRQKDIALKKLEELLNDPPESGWGSVPKTAEFLADEMEKFIIENQLALSVGETINFIKKSVAPNNTREIYLRNTKKSKEKTES